MIPKKLRQIFGLDPDMEAEITPTEQGLLVRKRSRGSIPFAGCTASSVGLRTRTSSSRT